MLNKDILIPKVSFSEHSAQAFKCQISNNRIISIGGHFLDTLYENQP